MEFLGVGPLELVFFLLIALILFGPDDMVKAGRTIGRFLRRVVLSEEWRAFNQGLRELRQLPTNLMREAGLEEDAMKDLEKVMREPFEKSQALMQDLTREFNTGLTGTTPGNTRPTNPNAAYGSWAGAAPNPAKNVQSPPPAAEIPPANTEQSEEPTPPAEDTAS
ncbi:MAG: hypothetical protein D6755_08750 [Anaerolineae bacterium]|nr:MAG: hypothetical protein D6755_08750 [Anaerolineae bacterium]